MNCSICNSNNPLGAKFCGVCGTVLRKSLLTDSKSVGSESAMIGFSDAVKCGFSRYSDFSRRATRAENWWWVLFTTLGGLALSIVDMILGIPGGFLFSLASLKPPAAMEP